MSSPPGPQVEPESAMSDQVHSISTVSSNEQPAELEHYKNRLTLLEDLLIDICCGKRLIVMVKYNGRNASILNRQIAQFGLQALQFCEAKSPDLSTQILEKVAERYMPLGRDDLPISEARTRVFQTMEDMRSLADGESIKVLCAKGGSINPTIVNQRVAIFTTQVLTAIKDLGVEKEVCHDAVAQLLSGSPYEISFFETLHEQNRRYSRAGYEREFGEKRAAWGPSTAGDAGWGNANGETSACNNDGNGKFNPDHSNDSEADRTIVEAYSQAW